MASENYADTFVNLFIEYVNVMFQKNPNVSLDEVYKTINLPNLLTCLCEEDQKNNLVPCTNLLKKIYHNIKAGGTGKVQCVVNFDEEKIQYKTEPSPQEYGRRFVNSFYNTIATLFEQNSELTFEEACQAIKLQQILQCISEQDSKSGFTAMVKEIYDSAKRGGGTDGIQCVLSINYARKETL